VQEQIDEYSVPFEHRRFVEQALMRQPTRCATLVAARSRSPIQGVLRCRTNASVPTDRPQSHWAFRSKVAACVASVERSPRRIRGSQSWQSGVLRHFRIACRWVIASASRCQRHVRTAHCMPEERATPASLDLVVAFRIGRGSVRESKARVRPWLDNLLLFTLLHSVRAVFEMVVDRSSC
jgi:hypothetical protein